MYFPLLCSIAVVFIMYKSLGAMGSKEGNRGLEARVVQLETLLEQKTAEYDLEIARAQAAVEIQSVMGRYAFYYSAQRFDLIKSLWSKQEDATNDVGVALLINKGGAYFSPQTVGLFRIHALTTPVVTVAADGLTARASWISPGISTEVDKEGKGIAKWCWIKYGVDFIKEDGQWKFWHLTAYGLFEADYYKSWADAEPMPLKRTRPVPRGIGEGGYVPTDREDWTYAKDRTPVLDCVPPLPYNTWDDVGPGYRTW
jgi:hypothetical protein